MKVRQNWLKYFGALHIDKSICFVQVAYSRYRFLLTFGNVQPCVRSRSRVADFVASLGGGGRDD